MASYTYYDGTFTQVIGALKSFQHLLGQLEAHCTTNSVSAESLLEARLIEDMLPFTFQVYFCADMATKMVHRLEGSEPVSGKWTDIKTVEDAQQVVKGALEKVQGMSKDAVNERVDGEVNFNLAPNVASTLPAHQHTGGYILPTVYFHLNMAYAILRSKGVKIGKKDYMGSFIGPYIGA